MEKAEHTCIGQWGFRPLMGIIYFNPIFGTTDICWFQNAKNGEDCKSTPKGTLAS